MFGQSGYYKKYFFLTALLSLLLISRVAFSQYVSPLTAEGGVDTHIYKTDTVLFEATAMEDGDVSIAGRTFYTGFSMLHSPYLSTLYIPLKYCLSDNFQLSFSLPFITKTLIDNSIHYIKSGYGDTMLGLTGFVELLDIFSSSTTLRITLPTGNVNAQDFSYYIPMGYGGKTASLQECISSNTFDAGLVSFRLFFSAIGIYYFTSMQQIDVVERNTYDKTHAWSVMGGVELGVTDNLSFQLKANYINIAERQYQNSSAPGEWIDADDSVKQINILPFIKYQFLDDISGQVGVIYPVKTNQDTDLVRTYVSKWKIAMCIEKRFGGGESLETKHDQDFSNDSNKTDNLKKENSEVKPSSVKRKRYYKKKKKY